MPLPRPDKGESQQDFVARFMKAMKDEFPDREQRLAVAHSQLRRSGYDASADLGGWRVNRDTRDLFERLASIERPVEVAAVEDAWLWTRDPRVLLGLSSRVGYAGYRDAIEQAVVDLAGDQWQLFAAVPRGTYRALADGVCLETVSATPDRSQAEAARRKGERVVSFRVPPRAVRLLGHLAAREVLVAAARVPTEDVSGWE